MDLAHDAAPDGLTRVGARPPLGDYLRQVWLRRQFIVSLAQFRIEAENQRNRLGMLWVVIKPLLEAAVYGTVFGFLLGSNARPPHFVEFLIIGIFMFQFFSSTFSAGAKSITSNSALVQSLSFPRMTLPLSLVVQRLLLFLPTLAIMVVLVVVTGTAPHLNWLLMIPLIGLFFVFNCGVTLITARLTVHFRDLSQLLPFITRLLFYTTGLFFSIEERLQHHPTLLRIADFQPLHEFLTLARGILLHGEAYEVKSVFWLYASVWSFGVLAVGIVYFWAAEERYGRVD
ncbi:ABC transporter permease [Aeromicrobium panaciterrae]|uniref:ABC transporter permease n=1 Tax=Aeromicrobium panaciterrae TaxID=363861 RepID=UPI0031DB3114